MMAIGRGLLLALTCVIGLALGLGGFLTLGLTKVAPPAVAPAASPQDWEIALELSDAFLADRINNGGEDNGKSGGNAPPIKLSGATVASQDDGTVTITVNTGDSREPKGSITYNRIVEIAYPDHTAHPNATYSILYERGPKANPEGTISKGGSVFITNGMRFRAKRTGES